jgi:hypothetical protein
MHSRFEVRLYPHTCSTWGNDWVMGRQDRAFEDDWNTWINCTQLRETAWLGYAMLSFVSNDVMAFLLSR